MGNGSCTTLLKGGEWWSREKGDGQYRLYDVSVDPNETHDLVETYPEIAEGLRDQILARLDELRAMRSEAQITGSGGATANMLNAIGYTAGLDDDEEQ